MPRVKAKETYDETDYLADVAPPPGNELNVVERRRTVLERRRRAQSLDKIADDLNLSTGQVRKIIHDYLEQANKEDQEKVDELRALENERLDAMLEAWYPKALEHNAKAVAIVLRIMERRAKMNGLDAAQRVEVHGGIEHLHRMGVDVQEIERATEAFRVGYPHSEDEPKLLEAVAEGE